MKKKKIKVLIDNGHGDNTAGKRSPDGSHLEWRWSRDMADMVVSKLVAKGYDAERIVPEDGDVMIVTRCRRVNSICKELGAQNVLLVSIHNDAAASDGQWHDARGTSVRVSKNASAKSRMLAQCFYEEVMAAGLQGNRCIPEEHYWVQDLGICRDTLCPAILTENLFMDNKNDVMYLSSVDGMEAIADVHVRGIMKYIDKL
jgi:N-acetylmuramoyl-L-alanine amidase